MTFSTTSTIPIEFMPNLGKRTAKVLKSLGIMTISQFKQLPEAMLIELFGPSIRDTYQAVQSQTITVRQAQITKSPNKGELTPGGASKEKDRILVGPFLSR